MSYQAQDMIKKALQKAGVIAKSETPAADEYQDGLDMLNMMLALWSAQNLIIFATVEENHALVAGTSLYTIGTGQTINTVKPIRIVGAKVRDSNNVDTGVTVVTKEIFDSFSDAAIATGRPEFLYFEPGLVQQAVRAGAVNVYPAPDEVYTLYFDSYKPLTEFATINTAVTFDPIYYEAIVYNLVLRLWREYREDGQPIPADLLGLAKDALEVIQTLNAKQVQSVMEVPGVPSHFNINTGEYN